MLAVLPQLATVLAHAQVSGGGGAADEKARGARYGCCTRKLSGRIQV
jgi:hypothetical protein